MGTFEHLGSLVLTEAAVSMTVSLMGVCLHRLYRTCKSRRPMANALRVDSPENE